MSGAITHGVVDGRGQKHEKEANDKDRHPNGRHESMSIVTMCRGNRKQNQHEQGTDGMGHTVGNFFTETEFLTKFKANIHEEPPDG